MYTTHDDDATTWRDLADQPTGRRTSSRSIILNESPSGLCRLKCYFSTPV
jgi:hypothetical protein